MAEERSLDRSWLGENPLAEIPVDTDKNERGRVLVIGGSRLSPGGLRLAGEAALRAGAGKVRLAVMESLALPLGLAVPEAGIVGLPESADGRFAPNAAEHVQHDLAEADCAIIGPGMGDAACAAPFLSAALASMEDEQTLVIDAAAIGAAADVLEVVKAARCRCILTPHAGEMARLLDCSKDVVNGDLSGAIRQAVDATGQTIVLKSATTRIADPRGTMLTYGGGGPGLATGGSGDVLAGIAGGLMSCGQDPLVAAAWAVWLHGEAGAKLASEAGAIGYLARELLPLIPMLRRNPT